MQSISVIAKKDPEALYIPSLKPCASFILSYILSFSTQFCELDQHFYGAVLLIWCLTTSVLIHIHCTERVARIFFKISHFVFHRGKNVTGSTFSCLHKTVP